MLNQTRYFTTARKELNSILDFITEALASSGMDPKVCGRTRFRSEDLTVMLMDHASEGSRLKVTVRKTLGATTVRMVCAMASMVTRLDLSSIVLAAGWLGLIYVCDVVVLVMLLILLPLLGRTSPVWFLKQFGQVMMAAFVLASSNAVMPLSMQTCRDKLGISPKIYSFSIPLGIVINMDGGCVTLLISALFLSKVYGIAMTWQMVLLLFVNVYLLSVAAPSVPGGILLCLTALLPQIGIPVSGVTIIIGLYFLVSLMQTMTNVTSTAVCTYIVDRWEKTG